MIWNTAILPAEWTVETLTHKHGSRPHNPDIAATFFRAGEVEAWGQGIERIQTYCSDYGCPASEWRFDGASIWTVFLNKTNPNNEEKTTEKTTEKILIAIQNNPHITNRELAELLGLTEDGIFWNMKKLKTRGILRRVGPDKGGHWEIIPIDR